MSRHLRTRAAVLAAFAAIATALLAAPGAGAAVTLPEKFEDQTVWSGLNQPTIVRFAPGGEVFVGEKGGKILVYENLQDPTPEVFANLAKPTYDYEDHGLLGLAIDPLFQLGRPYVYALYTFNHKLADKAAQEPTGVEPHTVTPQWPSGKAGFEEDKCANSEEAKEHHVKEDPGCEVSGVLVRLKAEGEHAKPSAAEPEAPEEKVLLEGWCQQATTHSIGDLGFGPEGDLYVSGGEGAMYSEADYGQFGNPCQDPVEEEGGMVKRLTALGGSLRSQSVLRNHTLTNHPTLLSGTVLRINPETGEGVPGNPYFSSTEKNARRIAAFGFRQPWRFTINDRLGKLFVDNVGNGSYEEIERFALGSSTPYNGGWPCYEGYENGKPARNYSYSGEYEEHGEVIPDPSIQYCIDQYKAEDEGHPGTETPFYAYPHNGPVVPGDACYHGAPLATDVGGNAFYEGNAWPKAYNDAFLFSDAIRGCIYVMLAGANGEPDPATATTFLSGTSPFSFPGVDIEQGPEGNIFYAQLGGTGGGSIHRIVYTGPNQQEETEREERELAEREKVAKEKAEREKAEREKAEREKAEEEKAEREKAEKKEPPATNPPAPTPEPPRITARPQKQTEKRTAKFAFTGEAGAKYRCKIDNKSFSSCKSPRTYKNLKPGKHTFRVYLADASGTRLSANRTFSWKIVSGS